MEETPLDRCPADGCGETEDVLMQKCSPGNYVFSGGVCGHWGFVTEREPKVKRDG